MNRFEGNFHPGSEAKLKYLDADFQVVQKGDFVRCAVTGRPIRLDELRYWSVMRQEAYASAEIATRRYLETEGRD
jgi:hypothetical protein